MKYQFSKEQRRKNEAAERAVRRYRLAVHEVKRLAPATLRIVPLGGQNGIGEKNMIVIEYGDDALVLDCGFDLGLDLPGVNYAIPAIDYLQSIRHKLRGYVISHGHMDHIGALTHVVPECPAPIYGSRFTIGMVNAQFEKAQENGLTFEQQTIEMNMNTHERLKLGVFTIELLRVTHSVPESSAIVVDTPAGRLINTGDFRLDPEPLDDKPSDIARLQTLGDEGVLLLMSESTNTIKPGRTPTEHSLQQSFDDIISQANGRVFAAVFSSNMNRVQMIIDSATRHGRHVVLDGRSMMATAELAVRLGSLKILKNTLIPMREAVNIPDNELVVICTGGQGEPGAAMSRMSAGEHPYLKLKKTDTVIISSTPIPGNERSYQMVGDDLARIGVTLYRHQTHEIDGCGPLHVSGHAARDEHAEMIRLTRPNYLLPIYGGALNRAYHRQVGLHEGLNDEHIIMVENGGVVELSARGAAKVIGLVTAGARLVDQNGMVVPEVVVKDRLAIEQDGFVVVSAMIDRASGRIAANLDIVTRGSFAIRDNRELMDELRARLRHTVCLPQCTKVGIELAKHTMKTEVENTLERHHLKPLVIPTLALTPGGRQAITEPRNVSIQSKSLSRHLTTT